LSEDARVILQRMEPDRQYDAAALQAFVPDVGLDHLREIMHELWLERQVERVGYAGWRRQPSPSPHVPEAASADVQMVKPEELFDHGPFSDFFK
jgi:hypothetical protein